MKKFKHLYGITICCVILIALMLIVILWEAGADEPVKNNDVISDTSQVIHVDIKAKGE